VNTDQPSLAKLKRTITLRSILITPFLMAVFFWPAGTFDYWEAWVYLAMLLSFLFGTISYLLVYSPDLLTRRLRKRETEVPQILIARLLIIDVVVVFLLPGFDRRLGWSDAPAPVVLLADLVVLLGYGLVILVFRVNRYTSRTVVVDEGQAVVSAGPYAVIRHPMYVGLGLLGIASPLALGSYWAILPALLLIPLLVARILNEEETLKRDLKGYTEYMGKTKYRLIPGIW